jgi:putative N6-adenine-specific DNA methylase
VWHVAEPRRATAIVARMPKTSDARSPAGAPASGTGAKLETALASFGLAARVAGARVLDVGPLTGGFTEALLAHGAAHVTVIDVGRGRLRADPRVEALEGIDFRSLPLRMAPGPFDFFAVDASFAAGRSVLRGLAFRLRPGAEGVVVVKSQLAPRVRAAGAVDPAGLRARTVERLAAKATKLGFEILAVRDSPVAGRAGSIEALAHLRFGGRAALPPGSGEVRREAFPAARAADSAEEPLEWFAVVTPGGEAAAARELAALSGAQQVKAVSGGVEFRGDFALGARANLWLRLPTRIVLRLGRFEAREFAVFRRRAAGLPWASYLRPDAKLCLSISQRGSRLYHTGALAENVALALRSAVGREVVASARASEGAPLVLVRGEHDRWTFSLDASGERLHRRGWRTEVGRASLRETLAALTLELCRFDPCAPLVDPLCGSGTFAIEAASRALGIAPGLERRFASEDWRVGSAELWRALRDEALAARRAHAPAPILASDRAATALEAARRNAERAGCAHAIAFVHASFAELEPPPGTGLVLVNPPYGRRIGGRADLVELYASLGRTLRERYAGWRAGVLVAEPRLEEKLGLRVVERHALRNGGLRVALLVCEP